MNERRRLQFYGSVNVNGSELALLPSTTIRRAPTVGKAGSLQHC
jgi:hypothetical protein